MVWDIAPEIFNLGSLQVRWYGLLFALSFLLGFKILQRIFILEARPPADLDRLFLAMILGTTLGARLGHCLFYEPAYYLSHPLEILKIWKGGLASHGAAIGILFALYIFARKTSYATWLWTVDRIVIAVALGGGLVRLGNFMNSEIIGKPTSLPWAIIFKRVDMIPRHPTQLYESFCYFLIFVTLYLLYHRKKELTSEGSLTGLFFILVFGVRFFVEFLKEDQVAFERSLPLNMGQLLSIPAIAFGIFLVLRAKRKGPPSKSATQSASTKNPNTHRRSSKKN